MSELANVITQRSIRISFKLRTEDIFRAMREVTRITKLTHAFNTAEIWDDFDKAFKITKRTTMTATGELESKLFKRINRIGIGTRFILGYDRTSNNQSVAQEFDIGRVHRSTSSHYDEFGIARCSRNPNDLYTARGSQYTSNPRARRRALALAIESVFLTSVGSAVMHGENFHYTPNFRNYAIKRSLRTVKLYRTLGIME